MTDLKLAVEIADLSADAAERDKPLDVTKEAARLVQSHDTDLGNTEVAGVLAEEQAAAMDEAQVQRDD